MKNIALVTLHGMGKTNPTYYEELEKNLRYELGDTWEQVSFHPVLYAPILQEFQDKLWDKINDEPANQIRAKILRRFLLDGLSDAASLENSAGRNPRQYIAVQQLIYQALEEAYVNLSYSQHKKVIVVAHSLGAQVISNYLWDAQHDLQIFKHQQEDDPLKAEFVKLRHCGKLITTGCNIPLFVGGLDDLTCFKRPNSSFEWHNYYAADDILGWPLAQLSPSYANIIWDHPIHVGNLLTSWNPLSHNGYWRSPSVYKPIVNMILSALDE